MQVQHAYFAQDWYMTQLVRDRQVGPQIHRLLARSIERHDEDDCGVVALDGVGAANP
jgi:hypothetical protein